MCGMIVKKTSCQHHFKITVHTLSLREKKKWQILENIFASYHAIYVNCIQNEIHRIFVIHSNKQGLQQKQVKFSYKTTTSDNNSIAEHI